MSASVIPFPGVTYTPPAVTTVEEGLPRQPAFLDVPEALRLPECSCIVTHETVMWYMEQVSRLGCSFGRFQNHYWIRSEQGKFVVAVFKSPFDRRWTTHEAPYYSIVWLTGRDKIRRIYISTKARNSVFKSLEQLVTANLAILIGGKVAASDLPMAVQEIENQLRMKHRAYEDDCGSLPIEDTAAFQHFSEWKKANFKGGAA